jgi:hypothetical protein
VLHELGIAFDVFNGKVARLSTGSRVLCETASDQAKIEGETHDLLILEECQDISNLRIRKSLYPMTAATGGTRVHIGTTSIQKGQFYDTIKANEHLYVSSRQKIQNHYFFPYYVCERYNSVYRDSVKKEKMLLGETSDEFRMAYGCEWLLERGMFITAPTLFDPTIALKAGTFSEALSGANSLATYRYGGGNMHPYPAVAGIDFGKEHDSTVVTVMLVDWENPLYDEYEETRETAIRFQLFQKHVVGWMEIQGDDYETQWVAMSEFLGKFRNLRKIMVDETGAGQAICDRMATHYKCEVVGMPFSIQKKSEGYKILAADLMGRRLTFPFGPKTSRSLECIRFCQQMLELQKEYKNGYLSVSHPDKPHAHDDYPDSLMLAAVAAQSPASDGIIEYDTGNVFI